MLITTKCFETEVKQINILYGCTDDERRHNALIELLVRTVGELLDEVHTLRSHVQSLQYAEYNLLNQQQECG